MTTPINILDFALAFNGGESETITLDGQDLSVRKNFTGEEIHQLIKIINASLPDGEQMSLREQMDKLYSMISDSKPAMVKKYVDKLMGFTLGEIRAINAATFKVVGITDEDGNFLFGA